MAAASAASLAAASAASLAASLAWSAFFPMTPTVAHEARTKQSNHHFGTACRRRGDEEGCGEDAGPAEQRDGGLKPLDSLLRSRLGSLDGCGSRHVWEGLPGPRDGLLRSRDGSRDGCMTHACAKAQVRRDVFVSRSAFSSAEAYSRADPSRCTAASTTSRSNSRVSEHICTLPPRACAVLIVSSSCSASCAGLPPSSPSCAPDAVKRRTAARCDGTTTSRAGGVTTSRGRSSSAWTIIVANRVGCVAKKQEDGSGGRMPERAAKRVWGENQVR